MHNRFTTIRLDSVANRSQHDEGPWEDITADGVVALPMGLQTFWGIPFAFVASGKSDQDNMIVFGENQSLEPIEISIGTTCSYLVIAHFCDTRARSTVAGQTSDYDYGFTVTAPGEHLADYVIVYADGHKERRSIRRRFEINQIQGSGFGRAAFMARQHFTPQPLDMQGPHKARLWGWYQTGVSLGPLFDPVQERGDAPHPTWSLFALPVDRRDEAIATLRLEPTGAAALAVGAVTAFSGDENPLRWNRLQTIQIDSAKDAEAVDLQVDLGVVAGQRKTVAFDPNEWLAAGLQGRGENPTSSGEVGTYEIAAAQDATISVAGHDLPLSSLSTSTQPVGDSGHSVRVLEPARSLIHVTIVDSVTKRPVACRVHFRSTDGLYLAPDGHRQVVNDNWFEDYGADLKLGATEYAYVEGVCQIELPVGDVFLEVAKGFEYKPVRRKLQIEKGQRELEVQIERDVDWRKDGWVTADTHVHFLSPETARLEGEAEGVNIINVLAAQWGNLFTNVGDLTGDLSGSSTGETLVWVGTENRNHFLGHISLLGTQGSPVFPLSASGLTESYFGDPTWRAMSEWAEESHDRGGLVIVPHFPWPHSEVFAEIVLGKVDGLEVWDFWTPTMDLFSFAEYYRILNCGYRVPLVGGTDKMSAGMPVGNVRTYARIGDVDLSFGTWSDAVKAGKTFTTSGPLINFEVEGHTAGDVIRLPPGGGKLHLTASAEVVSGTINRLQVIHNGEVVAETLSDEGQKDLQISTEIDADSSGWLAVRCSGNDVAWSVWPQYLIAHSSPVYLDVGGERQWDSAVANYLVTTLEGGMAWLDTLATHASEERHREIRHVFEQAIEEVHHIERDS